MKEIDKIAFIYLKDGKILSTLSKGKDTYYIPGGKREGSEKDEETLIRECKEELTIDIIKSTIKYYGTFEAQAHGKAEGVLVRMTCYMADFEGTLEASSEIQEIKWLKYNDLDKISPVDKLIFKDLYKKRTYKLSRRNIMNYDLAIKQLQRLKNVLEKSLENWENSDWRDNEISQEMIKTYKRLIQETDEEIAIYAQAKITGVIITREARNKLKEIRGNEENNESER